MRLVSTKGSSSGRIIRLVPVFILETHNQTNYKCLAKFVQTDNASSRIKTANVFLLLVKYHQPLRNGPDKNDSNNGNEHVGMQKRC